MRLKILIILLIGLIGFSACAAEKPNVIFIIVDTLRQDRLGCYGHDQKTSPHIDALAKDSVLFSQAFTPIPLTTPSHASIFSAQYPYEHGVMRNGRKLTTKKKVLAEILKEKGYRTAGFVSTSLLDKRTGLNRGFDEYSDTVNGKRIGIRSNKKTAEITVKEALDWLKKNKENRFFLWVHLYDPHMPYKPPAKFVKNSKLTAEKIDQINRALKMNMRRTRGKINDDNVLSSKDKEHVNALYDGEIGYADEQLGKIFSYLKQNKLYEECIIAFLADHGEMMGEVDGCYGHAPFLYEGSVKIPLLLKFPGVQPKKIRNLVRTVDIMPTLLSFLDIKDKAERSGVDLLPLIKGDKTAGPKNVYFATHPVNSPRKRKADKRRGKIGLRTNKWKYWRTAEEKFLFDIEKDPLEKKNLAKDIPQKVIGDLEAVLARYENKLLKSETPDALNYDNDRLKELKSLGYL